MSKIVGYLAITGVIAGLGIAALPLSSYATGENPANVGFQAEVGNNIGIAVGGSDFSEATSALELGRLLAGGDIQSGSITVTVSTSNTAGYTLMIRSTTANTSMQRLDDNGDVATGAGAAEIPATTDNLAPGQSSWGYSINSDTEYVGIAAHAATIATATSNSQVSTTINFGVRASASQLAGTYRGQVTITAAIRND